RLRGDGAAGDRRVARDVSPARHRLPPRDDGLALRPGAAAAHVSFLHPLALAGLAAAAIPALLHLLERRVPPELPFPAVRYLADAERRSARRLRLRHLLLLVLRTALIVAIVLAAARPPGRGRRQRPPRLPAPRGGGGDGPGGAPRRGGARARPGSSPGQRPAAHRARGHGGCAARRTRAGARPGGCRAAEPGDRDAAAD